MAKCFSAALLLGLALASNGRTDDATPRDGKQIEQLVEKLGSNNFAERQRARKELEAIGMPAANALRKAAESPDLETSRRAKEILRKLEEKTTTASVLTPKKVRLNVRDKTILEAVAELEKVSGYKIEVAGDRTPLGQRKITLDTGDTTFWEAFDRLCAEGGLVENISAVNNINQLPVWQGIKVRPARIQPLPVLPKAPALPVVPPANPQPPNLLQAQVPAPPPPPPPPPAAAPPVQIQAVQVLPAGRVRYAGVPSIANNQIIVNDGKPQSMPTAYAGAVRVRVVPPGQMQPGLFTPARPGESVIVLDVAGEPRLEGFRVVGTPRVEKAIDDQGQNLTTAMDPQANANAIGNVAVNGIALVARNPYVNLRQTTIRLKHGDKAAKSLKELNGSVAIETLMPAEPLVTVENVLKALGRTVKGKNGAALEVSAIEKLPNGNYQVKARMEMSADPNNPFGMLGGVAGGIVQVQQIQIQINGNNLVVAGGGNGPSGAMPVLVDAKGRQFKVVGVPASSMNSNGAVMTHHVTMVFEPPDAQAQPARLVLNGQRRETVQVPFTLKNVALP